MKKQLMVVYKFGSQFGGDLSPKEGINLYELHAREHDGKVLFTINKAPAAEYRDRIQSIILMTKDGSFAINRGDYVSVNGKDLIDSMSGNAYMVYVEV